MHEDLKEGEAICLHRFQCPVKEFCDIQRKKSAINTLKRVNI